MKNKIFFLVFISHFSFAGVCSSSSQIVVTNTDDVRPFTIRAVDIAIVNQDIEARWESHWLPAYQRCKNGQMNQFLSHSEWGRLAFWVDQVSNNISIKISAQRVMRECEEL